MVLGSCHLALHVFKFYLGFGHQTPDKLSNFSVEAQNLYKNTGPMNQGYAHHVTPSFPVNKQPCCKQAAEAGC